MLHHVDSGICQLEAELNIPWLPHATVNTQKNFIFWTHPFFLLSDITQQSSKNIHDIVHTLRESIITAYAQDGDVLRATSDSFDVYQLTQEYKAFHELLSNPQNHICFAIGIDKDDFVKAAARKKSPSYFSRAIAVRFLESHLHNASGQIRAQTSFVLTTDSDGELTFNIGHLGSQTTTANDAVILQNNTIVSLKKRQVTRMGSFAEYCVRATNMYLSGHGFQTAFMREGSVFNSRTFDHKYGSFIRQNYNELDAGVYFDAMQETVGKTLHSDLSAFLASRGFMPYVTAHGHELENSVNVQGCLLVAASKR